MVEKIIVTPTSVRGYGNILSVKGLDDYTTINSSLTAGTDTINNVEESVFVAVYDENPVTVGFVTSEASVSVGETVLLTATVLDDGVAVEDATVSFRHNGDVLSTGTTDANGVATYSFTPSEAGAYRLLARYSTVTSTPVSVTVNRLTTSISLASSSASVEVGSSVTLSATVTSSSVPVEDVMVTFFDGDTALEYATTGADGVASFSTVLGGGSHSLSAVVSETMAYSGSTSNTVLVTVNRLSTVTVLTCSDTNVLVGTPITLTANVLHGTTPLEGVTVLFQDGSSQLGSGVTDSSGVASLVVANLGSDTHALSAVAVAGGDYDASVSSSVSVVVYSSSGELDEYMRWIDYTDDLGNETDDGEFLRGLDNMIQSINGRGDL